MSISRAFTRRAFLGLALLTSLAGVQSALAANYDLVAQPQPTDAPAGKIEVLEFFSFACPHCAHLEPLFEAWIKKQGKDVVIRRVPVVFRREWQPLAKMYYTLESLGEMDRLAQKVFNALHVENKDLTDEKTQLDWVAANGIDRKRYQDAYNSFSIQSRLQRGQLLMQAYKITGVPALIVGGKYSTSGTQAGTLEAAITTLDELVAKVRKEQVRK